jgi:hypothetical protein
MSDNSTDWVEDWPEPPAPRSRRGLLLALILLVVGAGALAFVRFRPDDSGSSGERPAKDAPDTTAHLLVAIEGGEERLPAIVLVANSANGTSVIHVPATTQVEVPGVGSLTLASALTQTGPEGLAVSLANAIGIKTPRALVAAAPVAAQTVDAIGGVRVEVPQDVVVQEGDEQRKVFERGTTQMDGTRFVEYMTTSFPSQLELDRVVRQKAGWRAFVRKLRDSDQDRPLIGWRGDVDGSAAIAFVRDTTASPREASLPVKRQGLTGADTYSVDDAELDALRTELDAFVVVRTERGRRVRLLVGSAEAIGPQVGRVLVDAGYVIVLTGRASRDYASTEVVVPKDVADAEATGEKVVELLGTGTVAITNRQTSVADIIVVVGSDWAQKNGSPPR